MVKEIEEVIPGVRTKVVASSPGSLIREVAIVTVNPLDFALMDTSPAP